MIRLAPGIHLDIASADYFADPCEQPSLTQSIASVLLERSPRHAALRHPRLNPAWEPYEDTKFAMGNAAHKILIGRGKQLAVFNAPDWNATGMGKGSKKELHEKRDEALARGEVPILAHQHSSALAMADSLIEQIAPIPQCALAFDPKCGGHGEVVIIAEYQGVMLRSMIDWMHSTTELHDLKTTGMAAGPERLAYAMVDGEWDLQAAMQERILDVIDPPGRGRRHHYFYWQEWNDPYEMVVCELPESVMTIGRAKLDKAIGIWRDCITNNRWHGYPRVVHSPAYPPYLEARVVEQLMGDSEGQIADRMQSGAEDYIVERQP